MEELEALRKLVEEHDYIHALELIDEMDEIIPILLNFI